MNALIYYNVCIDLSWQVMWMFYNSESFDLMYDDIYTKSTKNCDFISLIDFLNYKAFFPTSDKKKILLLKDHINAFFYSQFVSEIRDKYNYMKHRGSYHIDGLGLNDESMCVSLMGANPLMLKRKNINTGEWYDKLIDFDKKFVDYFETIIHELMPEDYFDSRINMTDMFNYGIKLHKYLSDKNI